MDDKRPHDERNARAPSLARSLVTGSLWTILIRWVSRLLGIISLGICARVLTPADYGLVAMAMVVVGFSTIIVEFGLDASLIRAQSPNPDTYSTAWTLRIMQGAVVASLIIVASPVAVHVYNDPRVMPIMLAVAMSGLVGSFQNIYVVDFRKTLNFRLDFIFSLIPRLCSFVAAVTAVLWLESYWGLVLGICTNDVCRTIMSYLIIRRRAAWGLSEWRSLTSFSTWYFLRGLGEFLSFEFDRLIIGALGGAQRTGLYGAAREMSALPATEIVLPIGRALLPTLSSLNQEPERLRAAVEKAIGATLIISAPAALGFAVIAEEAVRILFGEKWLDAVPLVTIFSVGTMLSGFRDTSASALVAVGAVRINAIFSWIQAICILGLFYPVYQMGGEKAIAWLYVSSGVLMMFLYAGYLQRSGLVGRRTLWQGMVRPVLSAIAMYHLVDLMSLYLDGGSTTLGLLAKIVLGICVYPLLLYTLWVVMGRPNSSEKTFIDLARAGLIQLHARVRR